MVTIVKTDSGTWKALIRRVGWPITSKTFRKKRGAEDWSRLTEGEMVRGIYVQRVSSEKMAVALALDRYAKEVIPTKKASTQSREKYRVVEIMKVLIKLGFITFSLMLLAVAGRLAHAGQNEVVIHGIPLSCTASSGQLASLTLSEKAREYAGGRAILSPGPNIMLSPSYLNGMPPLSAFFLFYHECAHLALPIGVGALSPKKESYADCYAIKKMREHGLVKSWEEFSEATAYLRTLTASKKGHLPGPERVKDAAKCAKLPVIRMQNLSDKNQKFCRRLDKVFFRGYSYLKSRAENKNSILPGYFKDCEIDVEKRKANIRCYRNYGSSNVSKAEAFTRDLHYNITSCLPSDVYYDESKSVFSDDSDSRTYTWENEDTGHEVFLRLSGASASSIDGEPGDVYLEIEVPNFDLAE